MIDNAKVSDLVKIVKTMDFTKVMTEIERREKIHGHVHFEDIVEALKTDVDPIKTPHFFEACKRFLETIVTVTIHEVGSDEWFDSDEFVSDAELDSWSCGW
jgi:hypothetical protein